MSVRMVIADQSQQLFPSRCAVTHSARLPPNDDPLLQQIRESSLQAPPQEGVHVARDADLMAGWLEGRVSPRTRERIIAHLSRCYPCRQEVKEMFEAGVLEFPQVERPVVWRMAAAAGMVLAASLVLALLLWRSASPSPLAHLQQLVGNQKYSQALEYGERLPSDLTPESRDQLRSLLEQAGYELARQALEAGDFSQVSQLTAKLDQDGIRSGRLANLQLRARDARRPGGAPVSAEKTLLACSELPEFGYLLSGFAPTLALPSLSKETAAQEERWRQAVQTYPDSLPLRLNLGYVLLRLNEFGDASQEFSRVLQRDEQNAAARLGLGIVAFKKERFEAARQQFALALKAQPNSPAAHLNMAMALEQLDQQAVARHHWERFLALSGNEARKSEVREHLGAR